MTWTTGGCGGTSGASSARVSGPPAGEGRERLVCGHGAWTAAGRVRFPVNLQERAAEHVLDSEHAEEYFSWHLIWP
ncbi:hypothetical protein [Frankia sp. CiP3]|uniref:hypothetical protein n=1 Tax=Frankia sp. CiP3 TaxID=2880971 RepID=UPI001EF4A76F|nr:hypothetical protein [Frankia sp. CiP3]